MNIKSWSTALLIVCLCPAAIAQKTDRYLEKPLPQGWGPAFPMPFQEKTICSADKYRL